MLIQAPPQRGGGLCLSLGPVSLLWPVPQVEEALVRRKKMELLQRYASETLQAQSQEARTLLGLWPVCHLSVCVSPVCHLSVTCLSPVCLSPVCLSPVCVTFDVNILFHIKSFFRPDCCLFVHISIKPTKRQKLSRDVNTPSGTCQLVPPLLLLPSNRAAVGEVSFNAPCFFNMLNFS